MRLLPHWETRTQGSLPTQEKPGSWTVQVALQPSPSRVLPSSQTSPALIWPSPQMMFRLQGPAMGQDQLRSTLHWPLQPSPGSTLPSSHCSMPP